MDSPQPDTDSEFKYYEETGQRYSIPKDEGLTLASYIDKPQQLLSTAVGILQLDPLSEEEEEVMEVMDTEEVVFGQGAKEG